MNPKSSAALQIELTRMDDALNAWNNLGYPGLRGNSQTRQITGLYQESQGLSSYQNTLKEVLDNGNMTIPCEQDISTQKQLLETKIATKEEEIRLKKLEEGAS